MNVWRLVLHYKDPDLALAWTKRNGLISIGWGKIGDIQARGYKSASQVGAAIRKNYPELQNSGTGGPSVWGFYKELKQGDLVILSNSAARVAVVEVQSEYFWTPDHPEFNGVDLHDYQHQRRIKISTWNPETLWKLAGSAPVTGQSIRRPFVLCSKPLKDS